MVLSIVLAVLLIGVDQLTKFFAVRYLMPVGTAPFIPGVLGLRYVENNGAAFSILAGQQTLLIIVTALALAGVGYYLFARRSKDKWQQAALLLIFAGGVGNLIDRIANGFVVDFFEVLFMNFAVFNVADCFVVVGFVLLVIALVRQELNAKKNKEASAAPTDANESMPPEEQTDAGH